MCLQNRYNSRPPLRVVCADGCKIVADDLEQVAARLVVPNVADGAVDAQDAVANSSEFLVVEAVLLLVSCCSSPSLCTDVGAHRVESAVAPDDDTAHRPG